MTWGGEFDRVRSMMRAVAIVFGVMVTGILWGGTVTDGESGRPACEMGEEEAESTAQGTLGMYLAVRMPSGDGGQVPVISPEALRDIVLLAKEAGCGSVQVAGETAEQPVGDDLAKEAAKEGVRVQAAPEESACVNLGGEGEQLTAQDVIRQVQMAAACAAQGVVLEMPLDAEGKPDEKCVQVLRRVGHWMKINGEAVLGASGPVDLHLPEGWGATVASNENTYLLPPPMQPKKAVELKIPARLIDTVRPEVLGQPGVKVDVRRIEEPGKDEPHAFMVFTIPATVWDHAVESLPVIRLINAQ